MVAESTQEVLPPLSNEPLYLKLKQLLLENIRKGVWKTGEKIPNEQKLAALCNVSVGTVRKAVQMLADEGVLVKHHGSGTYVRTFKSQGFYHQFHTAYSLDNTSRYNKRKTILFETIPIPDEIAFYLNEPKGEPVFHVIRHMIKKEDKNEKLISTDELFLLPRYFGKLTENALLTRFRESDSLYKFYDRELGIAVTSQKCRLQYEELTAEDAQRLQAPVGMKVLKLSKLTMAFGRTPIGFRINRMSVDNLEIRFDL